MQVKQYVGLMLDNTNDINKILNKLLEYKITSETNITENMNVINVVQYELNSILGGNK